MLYALGDPRAPTLTRVEQRQFIRLSQLKDKLIEILDALKALNPDAYDKAFAEFVSHWNRQHPDGDIVAMQNAINRAERRLNDERRKQDKGKENKPKNKGLSIAEVESIIAAAAAIAKECAALLGIGDTSGKTRRVCIRKDRKDARGGTQNWKCEWHNFPPSTSITEWTTSEDATGEQYFMMVLMARCAAKIADLLKKLRNTPGISDDLGARIAGQIGRLTDSGISAGARYQAAVDLLNDIQGLHDIITAKNIVSAWIRERNRRTAAGLRGMAEGPKVPWLLLAGAAVVGYCFLRRRA